MNSAGIGALYYLAPIYMGLRMLDLFSGTHSVGRVACELGFSVTSLDLCDASICCDVLAWDYTAYEPGYFDVIWASPCCRTFSTVRRSNIGRNGYTREGLEADMSNIGLPILRKTEEIIAYLKPKLWYLENPQTGLMKNFIDPSIPFYDVDYCKYTDWGYRKRTRIWYGGDFTPDFTPRVCRKDCGYVENNRHVKDVTGSAKGRNNTGQGGGNNRAPRYKIPSVLVTELLSQPSLNANLQLHKDNQ